MLRLGGKVIISGRNTSELNRVKTSAGALSSMIEVFALDLSDADQALIKSREFLKSHKIDVLINNAGRGQRAGFLDDLNSIQIEKALLEVNYFSVVALIKAAYEVMSPGGQIVLISSVAGIVASPYRPAYTGSKSAVSHFLDVLFAEDDKLDYTTVYPSYVNTNFSKNSINAAGDCFGKDVETTKNGMKPEVFAKIAAEGIFHRERHVFICELKHRVMYFLKFWFYDLYDLLLYKYGKKIKKDMEQAS
jgi:short-subunit dehydrogenase